MITHTIPIPKAQATIFIVTHGGKEYSFLLPDNPKEHPQNKVEAIHPCFVEQKK